MELLDWEFSRESKQVANTMSASKTIIATNGTMHKWKASADKQSIWWNGRNQDFFATETDVVVVEEDPKELDEAMVPGCPEEDEEVEEAAGGGGGMEINAARVEEGGTVGGGAITTDGGYAGCRDDDDDDGCEREEVRKEEAEISDSVASSSNSSDAKITSSWLEERGAYDFRMPSLRKKRRKGCRILKPTQKSRPEKQTRQVNRRDQKRQSGKHKEQSNLRKKTARKRHGHSQTQAHIPFISPNCNRNKSDCHRCKESKDPRR